MVESLEGSIDEESSVIGVRICPYGKQERVPEIVA